MPVAWSKRFKTAVLSTDRECVMRFLFCVCGHSADEHAKTRDACLGEESYFDGHLPKTRACLCRRMRVSYELTAKHARANGATSAVTTEYVERLLLQP